VAFINVISLRNKTRKERRKGPKTLLMVARKGDNECKVLQWQTKKQSQQKATMNSLAPCNNNAYYKMTTTRLPLRIWYLAIA
jgi:hypothetical protein